MKWIKYNLAKVKIRYFWRYFWRTFTTVTEQLQRIKPFQRAVKFVVKHGCFYCSFYSLNKWQNTLPLFLSSFLQRFFRIFQEKDSESSNNFYNDFYSIINLFFNDFGKLFWTVFQISFQNLVFDKLYIKRLLHKKKLFLNTHGWNRLQKLMFFIS